MIHLFLYHIECTAWKVSKYGILTEYGKIQSRTNSVFEHFLDGDIFKFTSFILLGKLILPNGTSTVMKFITIQINKHRLRYACLII